MRLICPNCAAQYEVDDTVIPETGRDVQCSNCGNSWFQPGRFAASGNDEPPAPSPEPVATEDESDDYDLIRALTSDPDIGSEGASQAQEPPALSAERRAPDPSVLNVLREEAEREARARRAEGIAAPLESQTELGLDSVVDHSPIEAGPIAGSAALAALAGSRAEPPPERVADLDADLADDTARGPRKGLLPDIEEINSTLTAASGRGGDFPDVIAAEQARRRRGGFRLGFSMAFILAIFLLLAYVLAPAIAARVPALAGPMASYVGTIDAARLWIDDRMKSSTEALRAGSDDGAATN